MNKEKTIKNNNVYSKCGWSAFDGITLKGWPVKTIVNGNVVYENNTFNFRELGKEVVFDK